MTRDSAERAIQQGAIAGYICGTLTLVIVVLALAFGAPEEFRNHADPWKLVGIALLFALSEGIRRGSRTAAVAMLVCTVPSMVLRSLELGSTGGFLLGLVFAFVYGRAAIGAFAYQKIRRRDDPNYATVQKKWLYIVWIPLAVLVAASIGLVVLSETGVIPGIDVLTGEQVRESNVVLLRSKGILLPDEEVVMLYSGALFSFLEEGILLTNRRVVSYMTVNAKPAVASAEYSEIADVAMIAPESWLENARIVVTTSNGEEITLQASSDEEENQKFLSELKSRWKSATK